MKPVETDMQAWSNFYDVDHSWATHLRTNREYWRLVWQVLSLRPRRVLEVGTGRATISIFLSRILPRVVSLDFSRGVLTNASGDNQRLHGRLKFVYGDAFDLPFVSDSFDLVISAGFFEHFDDTEIGRLMAEQLRVGHRVLFSVPNRAYAKRDFGNERLLSSTEWEKLLRDGGFRVASSRDYAPMTPRLLGKAPKIHYMAVVDGRTEASAAGAPSP